MEGRYLKIVGIFREDFEGRRRGEIAFSVADELQRVPHSLPLIFPGCQLPEEATTSSPSYNTFHFGFSCLCASVHIGCGDNFDEAYTVSVLIFRRYRYYTTRDNRNRGLIRLGRITQRFFAERVTFPVTIHRFFEEILFQKRK